MNTKLPVLLFATLCLPMAGCGDDPAVTPPSQQLAPSWLLPFEDGALQVQFRLLVEKWFATHGIQVRSVNAGLIEIGGQRRSFDITAVAEACAELYPEQWWDRIDAELGPLIESSAELGDWQTPSFEDAKPDLRLRIYPLGFLESAGMQPADVVHRADLAGTLTCVTLDRDESAMMLPAAALGDWGRDAEQVLALALANTRQELVGSLRIETRELGELGTLREIAGDSYYCSAAALWLDEWPEMLGAHGAFVAIPWRHSVLVLPFDDARAARAVPGLYALAKQVVADEAGAVAPSIWWRRPDAGFEAIQIDEVDGQPAAIPPPGLAELLRDLDIR